jgi:hypothetical protein
MKARTVENLSNAVDGSAHQHALRRGAATRSSARSGRARFRPAGGTYYQENFGSQEKAEGGLARLLLAATVSCTNRSFSIAGPESTNG